MVRWLFFMLCIVVVAPGVGFAGNISTNGIESDGIILSDHRYVDSFDNKLLSNATGFDCTASSGTLPASCFQSSTALLTAVPISEKTVLFVPGADVTGGEAFSTDNSFAVENPDRAGMSSDLAAVVPEPSSIVLMGTGILAIAATIRRRRKA